MSKKRNKQKHQQATRAVEQTPRQLDLLRGASDRFFDAHRQLAALFESAKSIDENNCEPVHVQRLKVDVMNVAYSLMEAVAALNTVAVDEIEKVEKATFLAAGLAAIA